MVELSNVTMVCVDTLNYGAAIHAIVLSQLQIKPARTLFLTDIELYNPGLEIVQIDKITSKEQYSEFIVKELYKYFDTDFVLLIQYDGFVLDGKQWTNEFLNYDYIGAKWIYSHGHNMGNGGCSIRSRRLMTRLAHDPLIQITHPEDEITCRLYHKHLEVVHGMKFAPESLADKFSFELNEPYQPTFGFHGYFHQSYRKHVVLARKAAMGDVIMLEPVMEWFEKKCFQVILDINKEWMPLFRNLPYRVRHLSEMSTNAIPAGLNFDMAYETRPQQLVLKSYYDHVEITDGEIRNSNLGYSVPEDKRLFRKYAVIHINKTDMEYRNIHGVNWVKIKKYLENRFDIIQIGDNSIQKCGTWVNTPDIQTLMYIIGGASLFLGSDSGPAHIAVACGVPSVLMFGSVNPEYRYANLEKIRVVQSFCPAQNCYHHTIGETGTKCLLDLPTPQCSIYSAEQIISAIKSLKDAIL